LAAQVASSSASLERFRCGKPDRDQRDFVQDDQGDREHELGQDVGGVATAAITKRDQAGVAAGRRPAAHGHDPGRSSSISSTGNRKAEPNAKMKCITSER
jgi:hypothetical protein